MIDLPRSTYNYKPKKSREERDREDAELRDKIEEIQEDLPRAGYRTIRGQLLEFYGTSAPMARRSAGFSASTA